MVQATKLGATVTEKSKEVGHSLSEKVGVVFLIHNTFCLKEAVATRRQNISDFGCAMNECPKNYFN